MVTRSRMKRARKRIELEDGEASMFVELKDGKIEVTHGTGGVRLVRRNAYKGDWDRIWKTLRTK